MATTKISKKQAKINKLIDEIERKIFYNSQDRTATLILLHSLAVKVKEIYKT